MLELGVASRVAVDYVEQLTALLKKLDLDALERVTSILQNVRDHRATIYIAGNGGSASTASHWVNDLGKATKRSGRAPLRVMSLSDNTSWMTALANDEGYERAFAGQLENFAQPGDVLIVLSASGNSANLVKAVELAKQRGVTAIGLLGFDGGLLRGMVDECIWLPSDRGAYQLVEDGHSVICHVLTTILMQDREGNGSPLAGRS